MTLKITSVEVTDYMGIEHASFPVGPHGIEITGEVGAGKSSLMKAILACLRGGEYAKAEYIRNGAPKATILVNMDKAAAKLTMRRNSSNALTTDGFGLGEPRERLRALFGPIDPLAFWMAKDAERAAMILAATPASVTAEEMGEWTNGEWEGSVDGHALKVIAGARKIFFDQRTEAKKKAKKSADAAAEKVKAADAIATEGIEETVPVEEAKEIWSAAKAAIVTLANRKAQAEEQEQRAAGTREKISKLRAEASDLEDHGPVVPSLSERNAIDENVANALAEVERLKRDLLTAEQSLMVAKAALLAFQERERMGNDATRCTGEKRREADSLEASLASVQIAAPTVEEITSAENEVVKAGNLVSAAELAKHAKDARGVADAAELESKIDAKHVAYLDEIIENLTTVAPASVAARSEMIPGVVIADDEITMDGKQLKLLSGGEAMSFAVTLSKRAKQDGKLLAVDELGRMNKSAREQFVRMCVADDWQLIGTRAEDGKLVIEQIEIE